MFKHIFTCSILTFIALGGFFGNIEIEVQSGNNEPVFIISFEGNHTYADNWADTPDGKLPVTDSKATDSNNGKVVTIVSEKVPGATCVCIAKNTGRTEDANGNTLNPGTDGCADITTRKYQCTTETGMAGFQKVFAQMIRFVINIVMLLGVLAVVGLGIAWSFAGGDDMKMKSTLKTWAINLIIGFVILFMFRYILQFLAPWVYK